MMHLDDGVLIAFADNALAPPERAETAEHVLACRECRKRLDELNDASETLASALALLDAPHDAERARRALESRLAGQRTSWNARSFVRAAGLILVLAAGASAAVPGSPVRTWIRAVITPEPVLEAPARTLDTTSAVSIAPVNGRIEIAVLDPDAGTTLRVRSVDEEQATVTVPQPAAPPRFRTSPGRIEVQGVSGVVEIDVPRSAEHVSILVNDEPYVEGSGATLRATVTAETRDGELMFRLE